MYVFILASATTSSRYLHVGFDIGLVFDRSLVSTSVASTAAVVATTAGVVAMCVAASVVVVMVEVMSVFVAHIVLMIVAHFVVMLMAAVIGVAAWFVTTASGVTFVASASTMSTISVSTISSVAASASVTSFSFIMGILISIIEGSAIDVAYDELVAHWHCVAASHEGKE